MQELLAPFVPGERQLRPELLEQLSTYLELLLQWNSRVNLTAVRSPQEVVRRHFGESIFAAFRLFPSEVGGGRLIDVGSGAGFPGLPIKLAQPDLEIILIESREKKATFLKEVVRKLRLQNVTVVSGRAETFGGDGDVVTLRAVESFQSVLPVAARLVGPAGRVALLIGTPQVEQAMRILGSEFEEGTSAEIPGATASVLYVAGRKR